LYCSPLSLAFYVLTVLSLKGAPRCCRIDREATINTAQQRTMSTTVAAALTSTVFIDKWHINRFVTGTGPQWNPWLTAPDSQFVLIIGTTDGSCTCTLQMNHGDHLSHTHLQPLVDERLLLLQKNRVGLLPRRVEKRPDVRPRITLQRKRKCTGTVCRSISSAKTEPRRAVATDGRCCCSALGQQARAE